LKWQKNMGWKIKLSEASMKHLEKYGKDLQEKINSAILNMLNYFDEKESTKPDLKSLTGKYKGLLRLRVGDFRIIFSIDYKEPEIFITDILPRGEAYKK